MKAKGGAAKVPRYAPGSRTGKGGRTRGRLTAGSAADLGAVAALLYEAARAGGANEEQALARLNAELRPGAPVGKTTWHKATKPHRAWACTQLAAVRGPWQSTGAEMRELDTLATVPKGGAGQTVALRRLRAAGAARQRMGAAATTFLRTPTLKNLTRWRAAAAELKAVLTA